MIFGIFDNLHPSLQAHGDPERVLVRWCEKDQARGGMLPGGVIQIKTLAIDANRFYLCAEYAHGVAPGYVPGIFGPDHITRVEQGKRDQ